MSGLAPVVIFAYRRAAHLRNTLESLMRCEGFAQSPVIVYGDGPRNAEEVAAVEETRATAKALLGDRAEYRFSEANQGLARSVIAGVGEVVARFGRVIVVEDDLELAPAFLAYMNRALDRYADDAAVYQVSGYMFDVPELKARPEAVFLPLTVSWGWATWKRAWDEFDPLAAGWQQLASDRALRRRFNLDGAYDYATMLERQMSGQRDSWAIRWYWTVFKANGLVLFPPVTLVNNHGFDGSGSHGRGLLRRFSAAGSPLGEGVPRMPGALECREDVWLCTRDAIRRANGGWKARLVDRLRRLFGQ